jgi:HSP20 family protein
MTSRLVNKSRLAPLLLNRTMAPQMGFVVAARPVTAATQSIWSDSTSLLTPFRGYSDEKSSSRSGNAANEGSSLDVRRQKRARDREIDPLIADWLFDFPFSLADPFTDMAPARTWDNPLKWRPAVDVHEGEKEFTITADLPGVNKEDIKIEIQDGTIVIKGEKKQEKKEEREGYTRVERNYGTFTRKITVPDGVDPQQTVAKYENGVLQLTLPKTEKPKGHTINIQ